MSCLGDWGKCAEVRQRKENHRYGRVYGIFKKGLVGWGGKEKILEETVGDCHEMENHELEEQQVNNAIEETKLVNIQYKLTRGNEKYSREWNNQIKEREIPGTRKAIRKEENNNRYGAHQGK